MLILGRTKEDKGNQLERLTMDLLRQLGYTNLMVNYIGPGGEEIDVTGDYPIPGPGGIKVKRVLCECKAHAVPVDLGQWLKFVGKVYVEEAMRGEEVLGCFVALSGINGNAYGNYDQLRQRKSNIWLVTGDELHQQLAAMVGLADAKQVTHTIKRYSDRAIKGMDIAYYSGQCYWIVLFEHEEYTILSGTGQFIQPGDLSLIRPLVEGSVPVRTYVDLQEEAKAQDRITYQLKAVLARLMYQGGTGEITVSEIGGDMTESELASALLMLEQKGWIRKAPNGTSFELLPRDDEEYDKHLSDLFLFLIMGNMPISCLGTAFYDERIDNRMIDVICTIQGNLALSPEEREEAITLLRWSPTALIHALTPNPLITHHRTEASVVNERVDANDRLLFFRTLYLALREDFRNPALSEYFSEVRALRELELRQVLVVKDDDKEVLRRELQERLGIGQLLDGPHAVVLVLNDAPQPWEPGGLGRKVGTTDPNRSVDN